MDKQEKQVAKLLAFARHNLDKANDEVEQLAGQWEKIAQRVDTARLELENAERVFLSITPRKTKA